MVRRLWINQALFLALLASAGGQKAPLCQVDIPRSDCGYLGVTEAECMKKGCCWKPVEDPSHTIPWCFYPGSAYDVKSSTPRGGPSAFTPYFPQICVTCRRVIEPLKGSGFLLKLEAVSLTQPELGTDFERLDVLVDRDLGSDTLHMKILPTEGMRYEIPKSLYPDHGKGAPGGDLIHLDYSDAPFDFKVVTNSRSPLTLFESLGSRLIFKEQYLEMTLKTPSKSTLFGLGEFAASQGLPLKRNGRSVTLWNRDQPSRYTDQNLYGSYPFLLQLQEDGSASGLLLFNSNGMDVILSPDYLVFKVIGGVFDLYFFGGPTPADVLEQYTRFIGRPRLPPHWSLGFHQCRYGYKNVEELQTVVDKYRAANIPLDTMWTDIDYMDGFRDFTLDKINFSKGKMQDFVARLHNNSMEYVVIVDPGIKVDRGYSAYDKGLQQDIFIKDVTGKPYLGQVWPGATYYPDFLHPGIQSYWEGQLRDFHDLLAYDGLWIDMNEASNFCTGEVCDFGHSENASTRLQPQLPKDHRRRNYGFNHSGVQTFNVDTDCHLDCKQVSADAQASYLHPPYAINNANVRQELSFKTIPTTAVHANGLLEYDTHNLYGLSESKTTAEALEKVLNQRSFVLSRSTFPGSGAYAAHWTGDNAASWEDLKYSIPMILNAGLNGIPFVGADICGFQERTTEELCNRWISAGAFYPFSRDHNDLGQPDQELYFRDSVAEAARTALGMRYRLLPYLAQAFEQAHNTGTPVARPLWFAFPEDPETHRLDKQWLLGPDILVSPVLDKGVTTVTAYLPQGMWHDLFDRTSSIRGSRYVDIELALGQVSVLQRGGSIVPMQQGGLTTTDARNSPFELIIALPHIDRAQAFNKTPIANGRLFYEVGNKVNYEESSTSIDLQAMLTNSGSSWILTMTLQHKTGSDDGASITLPQLEAVTFKGWSGQMYQALISPEGGKEVKVDQTVEGSLLARSLNMDISADRTLHIAWSTTPQRVTQQA